MKILCTCLLLLVTVSVEASLEDFVTSNEAFSSSIYKKLSKFTSGNFLASPLSAEAILALAQSGCKGATRDEIRTVLNLPNDTQDIFKSLLPTLSQSKLYTLHTANKIYIKQNFLIRPDFQKTATDIYQAEVESIDFSKKRKAAQTINDWVATQTKNKITNLVVPSSLHERVKVALINALYFQANWSKPFPTVYTKKSNFSKSTSEVVEVDTMLLLDKKFNYAESSTLRAKFLELPFTGEEVSMVIVLPDEVDGLSSIEHQIRKVLKPHSFDSHSFNVRLPKFRTETMVNVKSILKKMGVRRAFNKEEADLSGIAGEKGDLAFTKITQKTFIDVSERGVEAAAATSVLGAIPMSAPSEPPRDFNVDRPFIFYLKVKDLVLFVGRVTDPRH